MAGPAARFRRSANRATDRRPAAAPFAFKKYGQSGIEVSELVPELGSVIDDICVIRSMYTFNPTHLPGAEPVSHRQRAVDPAVARVVDFLRSGH